MQYIQLVTKHWLSLIVTTVVVAAIAMGLSFIPDQLYESQIELLIVQRNVNSDTYTAQKAAEKLGTNLGAVVHSFDFLDRVVETGYVSNDNFSEVSKDKQKEWQKLVSTQVIPETSIIRIFGYNTDPIGAENIAVGVSQVLTNNAADYHGAGESVTIKKITGPITSVRPVKPSIPVNTIAGGVLGFMIMYTIHLLRFESKRLHQEEQAQLLQSQQRNSMLHYEAPNQLPGPQPVAESASTGDIFPINGGTTQASADQQTVVHTPEYRVLDTFPTDGYAYGETIDAKPAGDAPSNAPVSMHDHINKG